MSPRDLSPGAPRSAPLLDPDTDELTWAIDVGVEVPDTERLGRLMDRLGQLSNVYEVRRTGG